jgi:hypothetical protein
VYFFLTGANTLGKRSMTVTVYARHWGQWVSKNFEVQVGESIGGVESVEIIDPDEPSKKKLVDVDFSTGCVVMRQEFKKVLSRTGFVRTSSELLCADSEGAIHSRIKAWDDASEKRKELEEAARRP